MKPLSEDKKNSIIYLFDKGLSLRQTEKCSVSHTIVARIRKNMLVHQFLHKTVDRDLFRIEQHVKLHTVFGRVVTKHQKLLLRKSK